MNKIITVLGTRPELVKLSPLIPKLDEKFKQIIVHTGQHYDKEMDAIFFEELNIRNPDFNLDIGKKEKKTQLASMILGIRKIISDEKPRAVIVFGDTNSTLAGAIAASREKVFLVHIEAGCRSFNLDMPEEVNRVIVDSIADFMLTPDNNSTTNLISEGISKDRIFECGDLVVEASARNILHSNKTRILEKLNLTPKTYVLATIHRAENTDNITNLREIMSAISEISKNCKIVFPIHPRTKKTLDTNNIVLPDGVICTEPLGYLEFLALQKNAKFVMTDSGGVQKEAVSLNVPCLILRNETEWMTIVDFGKCILVGNNKENLVKYAKMLLTDEKNLDRIKEKKLILDNEVSKKIMSVLNTKLNI